MVDHRPPVLNVANVLTVLRIVVVPFFAWALLIDGGESITWRLVATGLFLLAAVTDQVDGHLARRMDLVTDLGKLLDPIADKLLVGAALVLLAVLGELPWWVPAVILARELGITVMRFFLLKYLVLPASRGGKIKTVLQIAALTLFLLPLNHLPGAVTVVAWVLMIAAVLVTVISGADYVRTAIRVAGDHRRGATGPQSLTRHAAATGTTPPDPATD
ncbi:CDP-diacylglycerol--glycerol-3-phosphate 3-phosphatidyltransferase [Cellulomonas denverensis]|uniref:CDP-diacylglycerol--glycerol-3-phosphate 3-phosphatidyltransferase n=1 Tax=Cellulomonas denverensis TaxID=264297 RepID=A0A7X6KX18_9CELL|nr:CDP-diacylglycerol--glycerol-3-phosphate 3-phosphatidyltransferase [Cellulomonas denverensis]NKY23791.1 CDP-diacylglycerol--glycerol-3-phosphate 3-phosphatidyltransferase [Cellulomonas denverensis]